LQGENKMGRLLIVVSLAILALSFQAKSATLSWVTDSVPISPYTTSGGTSQNLLGSVAGLGKDVAVKDSWTFKLSALSQIIVNVSSLKVNPTWVDGVELDGNPLTQIGGVTNGAWLFDNVLGVGAHIISLVGTTNGLNSGYQLNVESPITGQTPIPAAAWLFGSALLGLIGLTYLSKHKKTIIIS
jgi:hypothetical protein